MGEGRLACVPVHSRCGVWGRGMRKREFSPLPSTGAWGGGRVRKREENFQTFSKNGPKSSSKELDLSWIKLDGTMEEQLWKHMTRKFQNGDFIRERSTYP